MDRISKQKRSHLMASIKSKSGIETMPKWLVGMHMRKHPADIFGNPDFANRKRKIALFIDGCFWHKCPIHYRLPKSNIKFWRNKIGRNAKRDRLVTKMLMKHGWKVIRVWEHFLNTAKWRRKE